MSWEIGKLSDIACIISGYAFKSEWFNNGSDKIIRIGDLQNNRIDSNTVTFDSKKHNISDQFKIKENDILMALSGATVGKIAIAEAKDTESYINQRVAIIRGNSFESAGYLKYIFSGLLLKNLLTNAGGAAQPNLSTKNLVELQIPLPPISQQKRIAAILDKADEIRRKREQAIAKLEQLAQSIFVEMFGDPVKNEKNFSSEQLRNLVKKIQIGPFGSQLHEEDYIEGGIPLINPTHIKSGKIQPDYKLSIPQIKYDTLQQYHLEKGDLIIGRRGEMGRCAVVTDKENGMLCGTGSLFVRLLQDLITPEYLCQTISSQSMREHLQNVSQGVTMANLNKDIVGSLKIIVPPLALQEEFAKRINQIEKLKADNTKALANHNALFASLQQQAFSGNL